jgi:uncharacterized membrane protein
MRFRSLATEDDPTDPDEADEPPLPAEPESVDPAEVLDEPTRHAVQAMIAGFQYESFSSPFLPPRVLDDYSRVMPDGAERVVSMIERQASHRQRLESRGQLFGFAFAMVALVGGIVLIALGQSVEGLIALIGALGGVGGLFIYNQRETHRREAEARPSNGPS